MNNQLTVQVASGDILDTRSFSVRERMSSLFTVHLVVVSDNPDIDFEAVVDHPARFSVLTDLHERSWSGICNHMQQVAAEENGLSTYELSIVPSLWLLAQRRNYRIFQRMSEPEMVLKMLAEWNIEADLKLGATYRKREYRVQYGESDHAFLSRMLEDAGISYYFEETRGETKLVLADGPERSEPRAAKIPFRDQPAAAPGNEHVMRVAVSRQVRPGRYTMRDHDDRKQPRCRLSASAQARDDGLETRLERYHYVPGAFLFEASTGEASTGERTPFADDKGTMRTCVREAESLARKRLEAKRTDALIYRFETNAYDLAPGVIINMLDHPRSELGPDKNLLIVASTFSGASHGEWKHRCDAARAHIPYRPALSTPKPKVSGVESATVVGPAGEEIHCDELGRVRVHFHWDRESQMNENSSCWIHVSQPWGGACYGTMNLPRVGQEVLVDFLSGDPDRPVIVGRVYTSLQKVPYKLPENKTQSGWRSQSSPGGGGFNEIRFEDAKGKEEVYLQAQRNFRQLVKHDEDVTIDNNSIKIVRNRQREVTGQTRTVVVGTSRSTQIGLVDSTLVGAMHSVMVSPPGEGGLEDATAWTMERDKITFSTPGGAKLTLEGGTIRLEAPEMLYAYGKSSLTMWSFGNTTIGGVAGVTVGSSSGDVNVQASAGHVTVQARGGDVIIRGGPLVKINT